MGRRGNKGGSKRRRVEGSGPSPVSFSDEERALFEGAMAEDGDAPSKPKPPPKKDPPREGFHSPFAGLKDLREAIEAQAEEDPPVVEEPPPAEPVNEDELALFAQEVANVAPLPAASMVGAERRALQPRPVYDDEAEVMAELADLVAGRSAFDTFFSDEHIEGIGEGIDRRLLRKLRKGAFSVRAHLDLHGLTRLESKPKVETFLRESRQKGHRCVLIVHGRGLHSKDGVPVLKEAVGTWLMRGRIARSVLAFCSARPVDGGLGAIYVLLRR